MMTGKEKEHLQRMPGASGAVLATAGKRFLNEANRLADGRVYTQIAGIEQGGVWGAQQRRRRALAVARIPRLDVGQYLGEAAGIAVAGQLAVPPPGPDLRPRRDEQLGRGARADDRADIPPVEDRAAGLSGKTLLPRQQRRTHTGVRRDDAGIAGVLARHQVGRIEQRRIEMLGRLGRRRRILGRLAGQAHHQPGGAVQLAGIEMRQPVMARQRPGDGALAAGGRPINGNDQVGFGRRNRHSAAIACARRRGKARLAGPKGVA